MNVELISWPWMDEVELCGTAAATCTGTSHPERALEAAMKSGHDSVLEHATFSFRVEGVSRALLAQVTRHRIASFSVKSQRYVDMGAMPVVVPDSIAEDPELAEDYWDIMEDIRTFYHRAVEKGVPKEDARYITPQAAKTDFIMTMNARELRHLFRVRTCNRAQWEIRQMADEMLRLVKREAPMLFEDAGPGCLSGNCPEGKRSCGHPRNKEDWKWKRT